MTSPFLLVPLEIRNEIYSHLIPGQVHLCLQNKQFNLFTCHEPDKQERSSNSFTDPGDCPEYWGPMDGIEREDHKKPCKDEWARRLQSTWGPHWMCEEEAMKGYHGLNSLEYLLFVCRAIHTEVVDLVVRTSVIHITDLETISGSSKSVDPSHFDLQAALLANMRHLSLTLRLPLPFYLALEGSANTGDSAEEISVAQKQWTDFIASISRLKAVHTLLIWLDHSDTPSWTLVNERATIEPLLSKLFEVDHHPNISIILPKLHPVDECEHRHFISGHIDGVTRFHRTPRQRYHCVEGPAGQKEVKMFRDFPLFYDYMICETGEEYKSMEEHERRMWLRGDDVQAEFIQLSESSIVCSLHEI